MRLLVNMKPPEFISGLRASKMCHKAVNELILTDSQLTKYAGLASQLRLGQEALGIQRGHGFTKKLDETSLPRSCTWGTGRSDPSLACTLTNAEKKTGMHAGLGAWPGGSGHPERLWVQ